MRFSLILSKITIVSFIQYHMIVSKAIMKIVSTCTVSLKAIQIQYAQIGNDTSNIIVIITINQSDDGLI